MHGPVIIMFGAALHEDAAYIGVHVIVAVSLGMPMAGRAADVCVVKAAISIRFAPAGRQEPAYIVMDLLAIIIYPGLPCGYVPALGVVGDPLAHTLYIRLKTLKNRNKAGSYFFSLLFLYMYQIISRSSMGRSHQRLAIAANRPPRRLGFGCSPAGRVTVPPGAGCWMHTVLLQKKPALQSPSAMHSGVGTAGIWTQVPEAHL
jgi:hypothetical protein